MDRCDRRVVAGEISPQWEIVPSRRKKPRNNRTRRRSATSIDSLGLRVIHRGNIDRREGSNGVTPVGVPTRGKGIGTDDLSRGINCTARNSPFDEIHIGELLTVDDKIGLALTWAGSIRSSRTDTHTPATPTGSRYRARRGVGA